MWNKVMLLWILSPMANVDESSSPTFYTRIAEIERDIERTNRRVESEKANVSEIESEIHACNEWMERILSNTDSVKEYIESVEDYSNELVRDNGKISNMIKYASRQMSRLSDIIDYYQDELARIYIQELLRINHPSGELILPKRM